MIPIDRVDKSDIVRIIDWNSPGIEGYTFHGKGAMLIDVYPHYPRQNFPYDIGSCRFEHCWWIYMPIDPGERVADLWVRDAVTAKNPFSSSYENSSERSLIVGTSSSLLVRTAGLLYIPDSDE
jgi:hypothetical protein